MYQLISKTFHYGGNQRKILTYKEVQTVLYTENTLHCRKIEVINAPLLM